MTDSAPQPSARPPSSRRSRRAGREQERIALNQLAEMGKLAAGLAHELKNPLSTLKLNLQLMEEDLATLPGAERRRQRLTTLRKEADRLSHTLNDFLQYAGRIELRRAPVKINDLLQDLIDFLHPQAQAGQVRLLTSLAEENPLCAVDQNLLKQAILNLLLNGMQAMPTGGELMIRTHLRGGGRRGASEAEEGGEVPGTVLIDISDTGSGIPAENLPRIFDAYFTTKKGGTGLGLPTTRRVIEEHQGHITVTSEPGRGSNFRVELPLADASTPPVNA